VYTKGADSMAVWGSLFPSLGERLPAECHDYYKLINEWVWFELQTYRGWL